MNYLSLYSIRDLCVDSSCKVFLLLSSGDLKQDSDLTLSDFLFTRIHTGYKNPWTQGTLMRRFQLTEKCDCLLI